MGVMDYVFALLILLLLAIVIYSKFKHQGIGDSVSEVTEIFEDKIIE